MKEKLFEILKLVRSHSLRLFILDVLQQFKLSIYPSFRALCQKEFELSLWKFPWQVLFTFGSNYNWYNWPHKHLNIYSEIERLNLPFKLFPNVSKFEVQIGPLDWLYALFGFAVRVKTSNVMIRNHLNGVANRALFMRYYELYLLIEEGNFQRYWPAALRLLRKREYQLVSLNYVIPDWYKRLSCKRVDSIVRNVSKLCSNLESSIVFKRVYIDKANGKKRPLGVPSYEWRIYLHMINNLLVLARRNRMGNQHGYFPGRGCHTVWKEIIDNIDKYKYIYEFDLKGFFDNVDLRRILFVLQFKYQMTNTFLSLIKNLNQSIVLLNKEDLLPELDRFPLLSANKKENPNKYSVSEVNVSRYWTSKLKDNPLPQNQYLDESPSLETLDKLFSIEDDTEVSEEELAFPVGTLEKTSDVIPIYKEKGVPQGASTSCSLSTLAIEDITNSSSSTLTLMYADDGLIFSNSECNIKSTVRRLGLCGSNVSKEKSKWFKKEGKYLGTLKFCGLRYNPISERLSAETRKGSKLEFGSREKFLNFLLEYRNTLTVKQSGGRLEEKEILSLSDFLLSGLVKYVESPNLNLFTTSSVGWFLSKLYNGSYNNYTKKGPPLSHFRGSFIDKYLYEYIFVRSRESSVLLKVLFFEAEWNFSKLLNSLSVSVMLKQQLSSSFKNYIGKLKSQCEAEEFVLDDLSVMFEDLGKFFQECSIKLTRKDKIFCQITSKILIIVKEYLNKGGDLVEFLRYYNCINPSSKEIIDGILNYFNDSVSNVSSFACDYLIRNEKLDRKTLIKYYAKHPWKKLHSQEKVTSGGLILGLSKLMKKELSQIWDSYK